MEGAGKIIRRSVHTLLKDFHYFATTPAVFLLPFSVSILLSYNFYQSCSQTNSISRGVSSFLVFDLPQTVFILVFIFPFMLFSLVIAKSSIIQSLLHHKPVLGLSCSSFVSLCCNPLVLIYLCNTVLIITINIFLLSEASSFFKSLLGLSSTGPLINLAAGTISYMVLTDTMVLCNLSLVVAVMDNCTAYIAVHKACLLRKGANSMVFLLCFPINLGLAAIQSLFRYRVLRAYDHSLGRPSMTVVMEGLLLAYLFSLLIVLDTITTYLFIKNCNSNFGRERAEKILIQVVLVKEDGEISGCSQRLEVVVL